jgi:murein DD-endopeptidase MepM/ murein hydrolase activator NlpD
MIKSNPRKVLGIAALSLGLATVIAVWNQPALLRIGTIISMLGEETPPKLAVPVAHVPPGELADTWGAPRSGDRRHEGIDIFAPLGRPVISTTNGVVFKVGEDNLGGQVVRVLGPGWQWHYYAHLDRFGDVEPGTVVQPGTVLGYVGNTGNARGTPHHLHYGVYRFLGGARNPYPLLADDRPKAQAPKVAKKSRRAPKAVHAKRPPRSKSQVAKKPSARASKKADIASRRPTKRARVVQKSG